MTSSDNGANPQKVIIDDPLPEKTEVKISPEIAKGIRDYEDELKDFAKDHFQFSEGLKAYFRNLPIMSKEARRALRENVCNAQGFVYFEQQKLFVKASKLKRFKELVETRKEKKLKNNS